MEQGDRMVMAAKLLIPLGTLKTPRELFYEEVHFYQTNCLKILNQPMKEPAIFEIDAPDEVVQEVARRLETHGIVSVVPWQGLVKPTITVSRPDSHDVERVAYYAKLWIETASNGANRVFRGKDARTVIKVDGLDQETVEQAIAVLVSLGWKAFKAGQSKNSLQVVGEGAKQVVVIEPKGKLSCE